MRRLSQRPDKYIAGAIRARCCSAFARTPVDVLNSPRPIRMVSAAQYNGLALTRDEWAMASRMSLTSAICTARTCHAEWDSDNAQTLTLLGLAKLPPWPEQS
jgi:hypothetical protein